MITPPLPPQTRVAEVRTVDDKCRMTLPKMFANSTVVMELISENEVRVRRSVITPVDELPLLEHSLAPLSDRDRDLFLAALENPPEPNEAFLAAAARYNKRHG